MKDLVVCLDGTWEKKKNETNIWRLHKYLAQGDGQEVKYIPGVGTRVGEIIRGGLFGWGLGRQVKEGYGWLAEQWREGDRIWLFGFSRGAYAARALAGLLEMRGIPEGAEAEREYEGYRRGERTGWTEVFFVGVFDTVGKLGVPDQLRLANLFDRPGKYRFHDTRPGAHLRHARHALAMDETRVLFMPTLWTGENGLPLERAEEEGRTLKQVWFRGVHSDVGGKTEKGTNDVALGWMMDEAAALGLRFKAGARDGVKGNPLGKLAIEKGGILERAPRAVPEIRQGNENIHSSVLERRTNGDSRWTAVRGEDGWVQTGASRQSVCTGLWLGADEEVRIRGEFEKTKMFAFVANGGDPAPDGTWGGHQVVPLDDSWVRVARGGYLYMTAERRAAKGARWRGCKVPAGRVRVERRPWGEVAGKGTS